jgi:sugar lactone lactonase YvrE
MGVMQRHVCAVIMAALAWAPAAQAAVLYSPEGNRLRRYDIDSIKAPPLRQDILVERAAIDTVDGRDVNGQICPLPDGSGGFVCGEDTGQPTVPPGWGVFSPDGRQIGKLTATYFVAPQGDPFGCAFDSQGRLFTSEIGNSASGPANGQLIMWFPPFDRFPGDPGTYPNAAASTNFCKIATDIGTATGIAIDEQDRVYIATARGGGAARTAGILRFSPPFPTGPDGAGGCGKVDALGSPVADAVQVELFIANVNVPTPSGIARAANGNWYVSSVLNGVIAEFDASGAFVRRILSPPVPSLPSPTGNPQGLVVDDAGDVFFTDMQLQNVNGRIGPGPNGKVRWIDLDGDGQPGDPVIIRERLAYPDALGILPGTVAPCTSGCETPCAGDCTGNRTVSVEELVIGVNIALGLRPASDCVTFDGNEDDQVSIAELIVAVAAALAGCPA